MPTVANGQTLNVTSGQTSTGVIVDFGGLLKVLFGGTISSTIDSGSMSAAAARPSARSTPTFLRFSAAAGASPRRS